MTAVVTLKVTACSGGAAIAGAQVTDGYSSVYTSAYGEVLVYWDNTAYEGYGVNVIKSGFVTRNVAVYNGQNGTTVTTCLDTGPPPPPPNTGGGWSWNCFIVTAATGSPESEEVAGLRLLRDKVAARSAIAAALVEAVYGEYWQFSPAIADRIAADDGARGGALLAVVRPLIAWYDLAGVLALGEGDVGVARDRLVQACPGWMDPAALAGLIAAIRGDGQVPDDAPAFVRGLSEHLAKGAALPMVDWAMLRPLERCWRLAVEGGDATAAVADWLADAPIERIGVQTGATDVAAVSALLAFSPLAQRRLLSRLDAIREVKAPGCGCAPN